MTPVWMEVDLAPNVLEGVDTFLEGKVCCQLFFDVEGYIGYVLCDLFGDMLTHDLYRASGKRYQ